MEPDDKKREIQPEDAEHDEQPIEHIHTFAPDPPQDPDMPTTQPKLG